jgi:phosphoribosylaminoimidazole-succinocarboxamide synthase
MRNICGNRLPDGMVKNQRFPEPIITPTTKSDEHDESITPAEIVASELMSAEEWDKASDVAMKLFQRGVSLASANGLILVDTKYELAKDGSGGIVLVDEIHTPDSSRYWIANSFEERLDQGEEPENIDKEFLRLWFKEHCNPYADEVLPAAPRELIVELSYRYIMLYEMITGTTFEPVAGENPVERLRRNLSSLLP